MNAEQALSTLGVTEITHVVVVRKVTLSFGIVDWVTIWRLRVNSTEILWSAYCLYPGDRFLLTGPATIVPGGGLLLTGFGKVCDGPPTEVSALSIIKGVGL